MSRLIGLGAGFVFGGLLQIPLLWNSEFLYLPMIWSIVGGILILVGYHSSSRKVKNHA